MGNRTILIGLDGGTFSVLDPLMEGGIMPFLRQFTAHGVRSHLLSVIPPLTPPGWCSLMTGRSPGNHAIMDFFRFESPHNRYLRFVSSRDVACETIWSMVSRHGLQATILNFPLMNPPRPIRGHSVPGWSLWRHLPHICHPPGLYQQLESIPGFNVRELAMDVSLELKAIDGARLEEYEEWIQLHIRREQQWFAILRYLMREDPSDLTAILFDGVDKIQHLCWRFLDPACLPATPTPWEQRVRDLCLNYFRQLDQFIEEIVTWAGPEANCLLASDHGFGPTVEVFYINTWLNEQGYLHWLNESQEKNLVVGPLGVLDASQALESQLDWARTTAYALTPSSNGIHIQVAGLRSSEGIETEEYEGIRRKLIEELHQFTDSATGQPVVTRIWTREEAFPGSHMDQAPDLTIALRDQGFVSVLRADAPLKRRSEIGGTHRPEGIFIAKGPGIQPGVSIPALSILQVAPALLYSLGLAIPEDLEEQVPAEVFKSSLLEAQPIQIGEPTKIPDQFPQNRREKEDAEGEEAVLNRLKALGYIE